MINIEDYGWDNSSLEDNQSGLVARVTAVFRERYEVICIQGASYAKLKTTPYYNESQLFPTVGDFVLIQYLPGGDSLITKTLPRRSFFSRKAAGPRLEEQAVAANFDTVFVVTSLNSDLNLSRIERYLTLAWASGGIPVVILTKSDLCDDAQYMVEEVKSMVFGVEVIAVSALTGYGLGKLESYLQPKKTIVILGSSGVGKSSLLNALAAEELMEVNEIRSSDSKGRHTTTHRQLFMLPQGVMIIDTPGMRELGMWEVGDGLNSTYSDIEEVLLRGCRFSDCNHQSEPGCTVKAALESGEISSSRWQNYQKLLREAKYVDDKAAFLALKSERNKTIARYTRNIKDKNGVYR